MNTSKSPIFGSTYRTFGMQLQNRHSPAADYRYGFQGQEGDPEVKGEGNSMNYKFRMHDPRLGRFFAVDPLAANYSHNSPYSFSQNRVIDAVELEGAEAKIIISTWRYENKIKPLLAECDIHKIEAELRLATESVTSNGTPGYKFIPDPEGNPGYQVYTYDDSEAKFEVLDGKVYSDANMFNPNAIIDPNVEISEETETNTAQNLLDNPNIKIYPKHTGPAPGFPADDNSNGDDNLKDAAAGNKAHTSLYGHAKGKEVYLSPDLLTGMEALAEKYEYRITEIAGGRHGSSSRHYIGVAFDIDQINGMQVNSSNPYFKEFMKEAKALGATEVLGPGSDANHATHVHIAWPRASEQLTPPE